MFSEQQLENLKILIRESGALSLAEQEEWLGLLPFMNDKQLASLESMLSGYSGRAGVRQKVPVNVENSKNFDGAGLAQAPSVLPEPPTPPTEMVEKLISHEQAGQPKTPPSDPKARLAGPTIDEFLQKHYTPLYEPKKTSQNVPVPTKPEAGVMSTSKIDTAPVKPSAKEKFSGRPLEPLSKPAPKAAAKIELPSNPPASTLAHKVELPSKTLPDQASQDLEVKPKEEEKYTFEPIVNISKLDDVKSLNVATLRGVGVINLTQKLKALCDKHGYFAVLFILEASPLYQTYLDCGLVALKSQKTYEEAEVGIEQSGKPYLTKPEFEAFSDLLRKIQATG